MSKIKNLQKIVVISIILLQSVFVKAQSNAKWMTINAGIIISYGLKSDGSLWVWGNNSSCELGEGMKFNSTFPVKFDSTSKLATIQLCNKYTTVGYWRV